MERGKSSYRYPRYDIVHPFKASTKIQQARQTASNVLAMRVLQNLSHKISLSLRQFSYSLALAHIVTKFYNLPTAAQTYTQTQTRARTHTNSYTNTQTNTDRKTFELDLYQVASIKRFIVMQVKNKFSSCKVL